MVKLGPQVHVSERSKVLFLALWLILLAGLMSLHLLLIPVLLQNSGFVATSSPVSVQQADVAFAHIPVVRRFFAGLPAWGDQYLYESNEKLVIWPRAPYYLLALLAWPIADRLEFLPLVTTLLLTPVNAALLYNLARRLTRSQAQAIIAATVVLGLSELFALQPWHWVNFDRIVGLLPGPIFFNAMVNPQVSFIVLCSALIALQELVYKSGRQVFVLNGLLYGLSFYTWFFLWTYLTGLYGVVGLWFLWQRDHQRFRLLVMSAIGGWLLSVPYWIDVTRFWVEPGFVDFQDRFALGRRPDLAERLVHLRPHLVTLAGLAFVVSKRNSRYILIFLAMLTAELLWKFPVVVGVDFQTLQYAYSMYAPLAGVTCVVAAGEVLCGLRLLNHRGIRIGLSYVAIASLLLLVAYRSVAYSIRYRTSFAIQPAVQAAYDYIGAHVEAGTVILAADPEVNTRLRSVAPVYVYVPSGWGTVVTTDEMLLRMAETYQFYGINPVDTFGYSNIRGMFPAAPDQQLIALENYLFAMSMEYSSQEKRRAAIIAAVAGVQPGSLSYHVDIVWQGPYERLFGTDTLTGLPVIYENALVTLYDYRSRWEN